MHQVSAAKKWPVRTAPGVAAHYHIRALRNAQQYMHFISRLACTYLFPGSIG